jgi:hypothetical protein
MLSSLARATAADWKWGSSMVTLRSKLPGQQLTLGICGVKYIIRSEYLGSSRCNARRRGRISALHGCFLIHQQPRVRVPARLADYIVGPCSERARSLDATRHIRPADSAGCLKSGPGNGRAVRNRGPGSRHERTWCRIKDLRRIDTRYDKLSANLASSVALAAVIIWWAD